MVFKEHTKPWENHYHQPPMGRSRLFVTSRVTAVAGVSDKVILLYLNQS